jgi:hypothetical protein
MLISHIVDNYKVFRIEFIQATSYRTDFQAYKSFDESVLFWWYKFTAPW